MLTTRFSTDRFFVQFLCFIFTHPCRATRMTLSSLHPWRSVRRQSVHLVIVVVEFANFELFSIVVVEFAGFVVAICFPSFFIIALNDRLVAVACADWPTIGWWLSQIVWLQKVVLFVHTVQFARVCQREQKPQFGCPERICFSFKIEKNPKSSVEFYGDWVLESPFSRLLPSLLARNGSCNLLRVICACFSWEQKPQSSRFQFQKFSCYRQYLTIVS